MPNEYLLGLLGKLGYIAIYLISTIIIELVVLLFFKNRKTLFRPLLIANLITNPILNLILPAIYLLVTYLLEHVFMAFLIVVASVWLVLEIAVVFSEAYIIRFFTALRYKTCFKYALIFNLVSFLAGLIINRVIPFNMMPL